MDDQPTVRRNDDRQRYEVLLGDEVVGYADHRPLGDGVEVFPHTVVTPTHEGKGLAGVLVRHALDDVRSRGARVVASCSYVARWIDDHPDYADLLADPTG